MQHLISIVIPTRNEEKNIGKLLDLIAKYVTCPYEAIVVDDGNDRTQEIAQRLGARVIQGKHKGLGQAILDGIEATQGDIVVNMDADLSHDPCSIPAMIQPILERGYDMTIGSRYVEGGGTNWTTKRLLISKVAGLLAFPITFMKDNTSGFFAFRKSILEGVKLEASSWKIMLELLVKANPTAVKEVPIYFEDRKEGESKFNKKEIKNYLVHLYKLALYKYKAIIKFGLIGISGALLHFVLLYGLTELGLWYILSAIFSIILASTSNYIFNYKWTFRDRTISNHLLGWFKYQVMSGVTDGVYLGLLALFTEVFGIWYMASALLAVLLVFPVKFIVASGIIWSKKISPSDADYEWNAFFKGSPIQKWWKQSIAKTVWQWAPNASKLLDIGCGSSPIIGQYNEAIGIDRNKDKLEFMQRKFPRHKFENKYLRSYKDGEFDHVLCIEVLEHLDNPVEVVSEIARVLKVHGNAIIATPDYSKWLWHLAEMFTPYKEEHVVKFDREKLEELCKEYKLFPIRHRYVAHCDLVEEFVKVV